MKSFALALMFSLGLFAGCKPSAPSAGGATDAASASGKQLTIAFMPKSKGKSGDPGYTAPLTAAEIALLKDWAKGEAKPGPSSDRQEFGEGSHGACLATVGRTVPRASRNPPNPHRI